MEIYVVKQGDNVDDIALQYGVSVESIIYDNQLVYPYRLAIGQALLIDTGGMREDRRTAVIRGFAYPFISRYVLEQSLPSMSELAVFSYGFTREGEIIYPPLDDTFMIDAAYAFNAEPILTLTPLDASGRFSNELISAVINNQQAVDTLINNLIQVMTEKRFRGIDIDFEYIKAEDRETFVQFVAQVTERMNQQGFSVSVDLAPKTSADQPGLLYEGKNYRAIGEIANSVLVMTYEWGYSYGPPMAVAPLTKVRQVVEYALTQIPAEKLLMGIPNYGYNWTLPYEKGVTKAETIGNVGAVRLAVEYGAPIQYDQEAQSPYFIYRNQGREQEVWFEDVRSISSKFALIEEFGLLGAGYWQLMRLFRANWILAAETFHIEGSSM